VRNESIQVWYFPPRLPELNPVEQCWNQFKSWHRYRFIEDISTLKRSLLFAFASINEPDILDYICLNSSNYFVIAYTISLLAYFTRGFQMTCSPRFIYSFYEFLCYAIYPKL